MRIVIDRISSTPPSYCWREDWASRYESAYSLLGKFAYLNAFGARDVVKIAFASNTGVKKASMVRPDVDLLDSRLFNLETLVQIFGVEIDRVAEAFAYPQFDEKQLSFNRYFRYCPRCAALGYHATLFQVDLIVSCPVHGTAIENTCPACGGLIPYRLNARLFEKPYTCPYCRHDFCPRLRALDTNSLSISEADEARVGDAISLIRLKQKLFEIAFDVDRHYAFHGNGHVVIARPILERTKQDYFSFLDSAIAQLRSEPVSPNGPWDGISTLKHTGFAASGTRAEGWQVAKARWANRYDLWPKKDGPFWALKPIYGAIRRYLWRRVVHHHHSCILSAARQLWWATEGEVTVSFCPIAYAFLQWRMFWEGFGVPQNLFLAPPHVPYRLLAWLCDAAPICPRTWPENVERWVCHHVFAWDCMNSFSECLRVAQDQAITLGEFRWSREAVKGHALTYWAAAGKGAHDQPVRLLLEKKAPASGEFSAILQKADETHRAWNRNQIALVAR